MKGYENLRMSGINPEILCVVSSANANAPDKVYGFFKQLGAEFITFIPLVKPGIESAGTFSDCTVNPESFGRFLCKVFDEWVSDDIGRVRIQIIEEALRTAFGQDHTLCVFKKSCGMVPTLEMNGDLYSCDHFADDDHLLGNILQKPLAELLDGKEQTSFGASKLQMLPRSCKECEVRDMCNGECPKNRFLKSPSGEPGLNYLCKGYRTFFNHIKPFAETVRREWLDRNDGIR